MARKVVFNTRNLLLNLLLPLTLLIYEANATDSHDELRKNSTTTTTTLPVRNIKISERSAMISNNLDRLKDSRSRNGKLSSILYNQRRIQNRTQLTDECQKMCKISGNVDLCRVKCRLDSKQIEVKDTQNFTTEVNTLSPNLVKAKDESEIFDAEQSVHGIFYSLTDSQNKSVSSDELRAKDISNMINDKEKFSTKKELSEKQMLETSTKALATTKINRRKYTRTSVLPINQTRPTVYRGRVKYSPSSIRAVLTEEIVDPYIQVNQKLTFTQKAPKARKVSLIQSTTPMQSKEEEMEIMEVSVAKQSSTEKNIFWKARNIIAINNYMRKLNPHLNKMSTMPKSLESTTTAKLPVRSYEIIHSGEKLKNLTMSSDSNYKPLFTVTMTIPTKIIYSRPTKSQPIVVREENPADLSKIFFNDNRNYQQSDGELDTAETTQTTTLEAPIEKAENPVKRENIQESTLKPTTISTSTIRESFIPIKRNYTSIPRRTTTTVRTLPTEFFSSTISTFLSNVSSLKNKIAPTLNETTSTAITPSTATTITFTETITPPVTEEESKTSIPDPVEVVVPPSPKSFVTSSTTNSHLQTLYEVISTTSKSPYNDVHVESQSLSITAYAIFAAIFIPLIIVVPLVIRQYVNKVAKKNDDIENYSNDIQPISPVVTMESKDDGEDGSCSESDDSIIFDFNRNKLKFKSLLGEGNFGQVWKAEIEDHSADHAATKIVAVKTERTNNGQGGLKAECNIMRKLLPAHPNVVTLLGACVDQEPHLLIMSYEMRGKLLSLLRTARGVMNSGNLYHTPNRETAMPLSPRRLTGFAYDIAKGMEYIAGKRIVHGDIAARNVLVDHNGYCKICDFGMSIDLDKDKKTKESQIQIPRVSTYQNTFKFEMTTRIFGGLKNYAISKTRSGDTKTHSNRPALPIRWMAPESLEFHVYSHETDVFAFGIVLWEIATLGITPYPTMTGREVIRGVIRDNIRPEIPTNCKQELSQIMTRCWLKDPRERPSFSEIRRDLSRTFNHWEEEITTNHSEYLDVSGFSEDYENGMIYFNRRVSEFECEI